MKDRAWFEEQLANARKWREQCIANVHAADGMIELCNRAITSELQDEQPQPTVSDGHAGADTH